MAIGARLRGILDELIATGYPEQVAERIASGDLPMDTASRMQRAEAMGFDPTDVQYHGTKADFTEFMPSEFGNVGPGVYMSVNPEVASGYASRNLYNPEEGAQVMPLLTRGETIGMRDYFAQYPDTAIAQMPDTNAELRELGITAINEAAGAPDKAMFDPRDIRSLLGAAFDPEYKGSNILGERAIPVAGAGLLAAAAMSPEEAEAGVLSNLIKAGYPEEVAQRIASGELPMDYASRMERAVEQDYSDDIFYKGMYPYDYRKAEEGQLGPVIAEINRPSPFPSFGGTDGDVDIAGFMSKDPSVASRFSNPNLMRRGAIFPLRTKNNAVGVIDAKGANAGEIQFGESGKPFRDMVRSGNYDSVVIKNTADEGDVYVALDPTNIRSQFAAFDPEYKGSNILGGTAAGALGLTALMAPEEAEAGIITKSFGRGLDPRFDSRVYEQPKLMGNQYIIDDRGTVNPNRMALSSLEGRPIISTMSDRTQAGGLLMGINDVAFDTPINLQGGQGFMFENPGMVWASAQNPVNQIMAAADLFKGETPLFAPWRMAPSGGDFATMTGETMIEYAKAAMTKDQKADFDEFIKGFETKGSWDKKTQKYKNKGLKVDGWKGIDDPSSREVFRNLPDSVRKELMDRMDKLFRNKGGIGIGEARSAVLDPAQATALDGRIQNIGEIFTGSPIITESGHASYPMGVPGQGLGYTDQDVSIFELLPDARLGEEQKLVGDPLRPTANELRALQMKPYYGRVTEDILRGLEARGVNVNANPIATAAAVSAGAELEGLLAQLPQKDEEAYSYSDILPIKRALDPEAREGVLGGYSPAYTGIVEDLVEGLLTFKTQAERGLYNPTAATEFLL